MREGMSAAGSKVGTRSPDPSASLDLMESLCSRPADAHEKKLCASNDGCMNRKWELMACTEHGHIGPGGPQVVTRFIQMNILLD